MWLRVCVIVLGWTGVAIGASRLPAEGGFRRLAPNTYGAEPGIRLDGTGLSWRGGHLHFTKPSRQAAPIGKRVIPPTWYDFSQNPTPPPALNSEKVNRAEYRGAC